MYLMIIGVKLKEELYMIEYEKFYDIAEFIAKKEGTEKDLKNTATTAFKLLNNY